MVVDQKVPSPKKAGYICPNARFCFIINRKTARFLFFLKKAPFVHKRSSEKNVTPLDYRGVAR